MLASVAQLHKNHTEATFLFRLVLDEYDRAAPTESTPNGAEASNGCANGHAPASSSSTAVGEGGGDGSDGVDGEAKPLGVVEKAELYNSLGESLLEVRHYAAAAPVFALARSTLEGAEDVEASSIASVEANEARMLSEQVHSRPRVPTPHSRPRVPTPHSRPRVPSAHSRPLVPNLHGRPLVPNLQGRL
jgi:hypothetical protein